MTFESEDAPKCIHCFHTIPEGAESPIYCSSTCKFYYANTYHFSTSKKALKFCRIAIELKQRISVTTDGKPIGATYSVLCLPEGNDHD